MTPEGLARSAFADRFFREQTERAVAHPDNRAVLERLWLTMSRHGVKLPPLEDVYRINREFYPTGDRFAAGELSPHDQTLITYIRDALAMLAQLAAVRERL